MTERLEGYAFGVALTQPVNGNPDAQVAEIHFVDHPDPARTTHTVVIPLSAEGKKRLVQELTGGIVVGETG